jgi:hypothetical protein
MPATPFTDNNGSTFYNINDCRTFNQTFTTNLESLCAYPCSEVIIVNKSPEPIKIYDNGYDDDAFAFTLSANASFTFRGITNTGNVSAKTEAGSTTITFRTQYFSFLPQR